MEIIDKDSGDPINQQDIARLKGSAVIEFGTSWCGYCQASQPMIAEALIKYPSVKHFKIEDGKGQRLGRSYAVKLWPTLMFLKDGVEIMRLVRSDGSGMITDALHEINNRQTHNR